jgi:hypothetical protein
MEEIVNLNLDREDIIAMVLGSEPPSYESMQVEPIRSAGDYVGGMNDHWRWDQHALEKMPLQKLWAIRLICKLKLTFSPRP